VADPAVLRKTAVPEYVAYLERVGVNSLMVVPLSGKDRVHGAFWLARDPGSPAYTLADLELLEAIADCAALAMDSARLHSRHREDRRQLERAVAQTAKLQEVTAALSGAATPQEVADVVAHLAVASMEGVAGSLVLPNEARTALEIVSNVGHTHTPHIIKRFQTLPLSADNPVAHAYLQSKAFFFEDLARYGEHYPSLLPATAEAGYQAAAALPLVARGEVLGVLWVRFATPRLFNETERGLMSTMMEQSAQALERARLYTRAQQAVEQRDELLSMVTHELRTPLAAMKLQIQSLQRNLDPVRLGDPGARLQGKADAVERQVQRLETLVTDLLDLSQLTAGKLALRIEEVDLLELVREVCARMADEATRANSPLTVHGEGPVRGQWDQARLDQVLSNLLSNAIKYGAGQPIDLTVTTDGTQALLTVRDRGIGILPEDHARIFERFERAVTGRNYSGFGVGLWICKQIVDALGGQIQVAESAPGEGSTFEVTLPCGRAP
jgi:signal transduction histidine kinase